MAMEATIWVNRCILNIQAGVDMVVTMAEVEEGDMEGTTEAGVVDAVEVDEVSCALQSLRRVERWSFTDGVR